jgi:hypothetical protein
MESKHPGDLFPTLSDTELALLSIYPNYDPKALKMAKDLWQAARSPLPKSTAH